MNCPVVFILFLPLINQVVLGVNILQNPGFETPNTLSSDWCQQSCCSCISLVTTDRIVHSGSYSALAANRTYSWNGPSQSIGSGHAGKQYRVKGWFKLDSASQWITQNVNIMATYSEPDGSTVYRFLGGVLANTFNWKEVDNFYRFASNVLGDVRVYVETQYGVTPYYDFLSDDLALEEQEADPNWRQKANADIDRYRKRDVTLILSGAPAQFNAHITQTKSRFPFGTAINTNLLHNCQYKQVFLDNFNYAVMENEMKWRPNEWNRDQVDFRAADAILYMLEYHGIPCRGHTVFWGAEETIQQWVRDLRYDPTALRAEMLERIEDATANFRGRIVSWDVNNEMLHNRWFRDALGESIPIWMFQETRRHDPNVCLFLNDYNILTTGDSLDEMLDQAATLRSQGADVQGLGIQSHFSDSANNKPDYEVLKTRLDRLATSGLPVWISELDILDADVNSRAERLETVVRTAFAHPNVEGILLWGFWSESHWRGANGALWDSDWTINAAGQRWQQLMQGWRTDVVFNQADLGGSASNEYNYRGFHGSYRLEVDGYQAIEFEVTPGTDRQTIVANLTPQG